MCPSFNRPGTAAGGKSPASYTRDKSPRERQSRRRQEAPSGRGDLDLRARAEGQPIFSDKVYNIFNRELQKYQLNFRQHT